MKKKEAPGAPRRRKKFDLHKALFVLPNAFTASSIFCGFVAINKSMSGTPQDLYAAAWFIILGTFFDASDGRVARLTKTQSEFGREFDSLADVITFGVAPGILVYNWALKSLGNTGLFISFAYALCGAIRLARFNVLATRETGPSYHFIGLPIPLAAAAVVSLVLATYNTVEDLVQGPTLAIVVVVLSFLMVSTVRYSTFKNLKLTRKTVPVILFILGTMVWVGWASRPAVAVLLFVWGYLLVGMLEEVVFFRPRRRAALAAKRALEEEEAAAAAPKN